MSSCCGRWKYFRGKEGLFPKLPQPRWLPPPHQNNSNTARRLWSQTPTWRHYLLQLELTPRPAERGEGPGLNTCAILLLVFLKSLCFKERDFFPVYLSTLLHFLRLANAHLHCFWKALSCGAFFYEVLSFFKIIKMIPRFSETMCSQGSKRIMTWYP